MNSSINSLNEKRANTCQIIKQHKLVAIIRLAEQSDVANVIECLVQGGVKVLEITSNTPNFCQEIVKARQLFPEVLIGAGTILNDELAEQAIESGAQFLVTPNTDKAVVDTAHCAGVPVLMGALTPTEVCLADKYGADFIKIFPAGAMGINYIKDLAGPFSGRDLIAVGGVNSDNVKQWLESGVIGVGVGNDLTKAARTEIEKHALVEKVKNYVGKTA